MKFSLGQTYMTRGIKALLEEKKVNMLALSPLISRHMKNDSELSGEDLECNEEEIKSNCGRVFSKYTFLDEEIYIITDGLGSKEHNHTTVLLTEEY